LQALVARSGNTNRSVRQHLAVEHQEQAVGGAQVVRRADLSVEGSDKSHFSRGSSRSV
jgi:hypothetical protein